MADVIMELNGKRKRVSADKVAGYTAIGAKVVSESQGTTTLEQRGPVDPAGLKPLPNAEVDDEFALRNLVPQALQKPLDPSNSVDAFATGAAKFATGGFSDTAAGAGAGLGAGFQKLRDDGTVGEAWDAAKGAFGEASKGMRKTEDEAWEKSPIAYGGGAITGALGTAPLAGAGKTLPQQAARGAAMGGVSGVGLGGDDEGVMDDLISAYIGASMGGAMPFMGPALKELGMPAIKAVTGKVRDATSGPLGKTIVQTGKDAANDAMKLIPGAKALTRFGSRYRANSGQPAPLKPSMMPEAEGVFSMVDDIEAPQSMLDLEPPRQPITLDVQPFDPKAPPRPDFPAMAGMRDIMKAPPASASPADDVMNAIDEIDQGNGLPDWMNQSQAEDWGTRPRTDLGGFNGGPTPTPEVLPPSRPLPDPDFLEGIAARNKGGAVTPRTLRQAQAARPDVTIGDSVDRLMAAPESARGSILEQITKTKGADYAKKVAKAAGMTARSVPFG